MSNRIVIITNNERLVDELFSNDVKCPRTSKKNRRHSVDAFAETADEGGKGSEPCRVRHAIPENLRPGLCEVAGLVRRARLEMLNGNTEHAAITLGRVNDILDREINK